MELYDDETQRRAAMPFIPDVRPLLHWFHLNIFIFKIQSVANEASPFAFSSEVVIDSVNPTSRTLHICRTYLFITKTLYIVIISYVSMQSAAYLFSIPARHVFTSNSLVCSMCIQFCNRLIGTCSNENRTSMSWFQTSSQSNKIDYTFHSYVFVD